MLTVKSFAASAFIVGRGVEPLGVDRTAGGGFVFPDDAAPLFTEYQRIARKLNAMLDDQTTTHGAR